MTTNRANVQETVLFWSGGKDAALALCELQDSGEVARLLTTYDETSGRVPFQSLSIDAIRLQARSLGLPLIEVGLPPQAPNEVYIERVLGALEREVGESATVAFGDLFLEEIRTWREEMFRDTAYRTTFPLWNRDTEELAAQFVDRGFRAAVSCVDTRVLSVDELGAMYDRSFLDRLPPGVDPCGENGEFHTVVFDGPPFGEALRFDLGERDEAEPYARVEVKARR